ncbi:hypothetical protein D1007_48561 [Hordeum vulgare]|nr:hypothetical protein D1007_48561 [Hordeum vulgare]
MSLSDLPTTTAATITAFPATLAAATAAAPVAAAGHLRSGRLRYYGPGSRSCPRPFPGGDVLGDPRPHHGGLQPPNLPPGSQYPRVYLTNSGSRQALVTVNESWSPFLLGNNVASGEIGRNTSRSDHLFDSLRFSLLTEAMVEASNATGAHNGLKHIENMVLFQYLVCTLEADFVPRHIAYKESLDWVIIRESVLNVLLGSRKLVFKMFVKNCISLLNQHQREVEDDISYKSASDLDSSLTFSSLEFEREALTSVKKLFIMVINLDLIRKEADKLGLTSRADGLRNPILEVILEELTYNQIYLSPFLLAFTEWKWKLQIILQYFSRYQVKHLLLGYNFDNYKSFQVCLSLDGDSSKANDAAKMMGASLLEISCKFVSAFQNLRKINTSIQISQFEKEALFTAATLTRKLQNE